MNSGFSQHPNQNQYPPTNIGLTHIQSPQQNGFNNDQRSFEDNGNANDHYVFPNNQRRDEGKQNAAVDQPPIFADEDGEKDNLQDKTGPVDVPQLPHDLFATTSLPALTPVPVSSQERSGINFANFRKYNLLRF